MTGMVLCVAAVVVLAAAAGAEVVVPADASPRVRYGAERLRMARPPARVAVRVVNGLAQGPEGYRIDTGADGTITIDGADDSGAMYGCLDVARRIKAGERMAGERMAESPVYRLRGTCIGMQKTYILPGRRVYEYPYTPELFPFFYDKAMWAEYLDFLALLRMNTLYLWSGQPFASLVKVPGYEYAQEVSDEVFERNAEMFRWLATECDRRGIWLVQMFYSIILPKPLAERHGLSTQLSSPQPVAADYTRKSLAEFVKQYPNVGLMVCLGEALQGQDNQTRWLCEVILPGIKDGMKAAGLKAEPPVVIRTHATDLSQAMPAALKVYRNLYTEAKFNGESLTTWEPRGVRQQVHLEMSRLGSTHLINVHILANLEPFRYGAQRFIKKCMQAGRDRLGARGLHLYPLFFWNWPDSPDKTDPPLKQWRRDWMWFEAWARYAWNPDIDEAEDRAYWIGRLKSVYGTTDEAAGRILDACNDAGECAPRILRRFGITEGNRQTLSLGMTLDQLVHPERYRPFPELWESQSPPGERLQEYVAREWKKQKHEGETPPQIIAEILEFSEKAAAAIDAAAASVTQNRAEFDRLRNDVHCIGAMSRFYAAKAKAAMLVLRHHYSRDPADLKRAAAHLAESLEHYRQLSRLAGEAYTAANSMQTGQRKIPVSGGVDGRPAHYHWSQVLGLYESELADFQRKLAALAEGGEQADETRIARLPDAAVTVLSQGAQTYEVQVGALVFTDQQWAIQSLAAELAGLTGIRFSHERAAAGKYEPVEFEVDQPVQVLIGYVKGSEKAWLKPPDLETDAGADERGGTEPLILNAATIGGLPAVDVHAMKFGRGRHRLEMRGTGSFVVLGVVPQSAAIEKRDAERPAGR